MFLYCFILYLHDIIYIWNVVNLEIVKNYNNEILYYLDVLEQIYLHFSSPTSVIPPVSFPSHYINCRKFSRRYIFYYVVPQTSLPFVVLFFIIEPFLSYLYFFQCNTQLVVLYSRCFYIFVLVKLMAAYINFNVSLRCLRGST